MAEPVLPPPLPLTDEELEVIQTWTDANYRDDGGDMAVHSLSRVLESLAAERALRVSLATALRDLLARYGWCVSEGLSANEFMGAELQAAREALEGR